MSKEQEKTRPRKEWEERCITAIIGLLCDETVDIKPKPGEVFEPYLTGIIRFGKLLQGYKKNEDQTIAIETLKFKFGEANNVVSGRLSALEDNPTIKKTHLEKEIREIEAKHKTKISKLHKQIRNMEDRK
jgi:hypothetical protein